VISGALVEKFVGILLVEADRTAERAGLPVARNATGMLVAWSKAKPYHLRQLVLCSTTADWRTKRFLLMKLTQPHNYEVIYARFLAVLVERMNDGKMGSGLVSNGPGAG
jgi:hypothetical protein